MRYVTSAIVSLVKSGCRVSEPEHWKPPEGGEHMVATKSRTYEARTAEVDNFFGRALSKSTHNYTCEGTSYAVFSFLDKAETSSCRRLTVKSSTRGISVAAAVDVLVQGQGVEAKKEALRLQVLIFWLAVCTAIVRTFRAGAFDVGVVVLAHRVRSEERAPAGISQYGSP